MALPTTISGVTVPFNPTFMPPVISAAGNVYVIAHLIQSGTFLLAFKASDPTSSFSEQDSANRPTISTSSLINLPFAIRSDGDLIHIVSQDHGDGGVFEIQYSRFDMASDTWVSFTGDTAPRIADGSVAGGTGHDLVVRSTGEIVAGISGAPDKLMGTDYKRIDAAYSTDGTNWTTEDATNQTGAQIHFTNPICVRGAGDRVHIFFKDDTNNTLKVSTLLSNNTWGSRNVQIDAGIVGDDLPIGRAVNNGGTIYVPYIDSDGTISVASFTSADTPSGFTITTGVSDVAPKVVTSGFGLQGLSLDGTDLHLAYIRSSDDDLAHDVDIGSGWGADTVERTLASITHLSSNVIDR